MDRTLSIVAHLGNSASRTTSASQWRHVVASTILRPTQPVERDAGLDGTTAAAAVIGPPPPASGGVHIAQMLNILEGFDIAAMGFGSPDSIHLLAEILKIAFADRAVTVADPAFVKAPIERVISKAYASERRAEIDMARARGISRRAASAASNPPTRRM